MKLQASAQLGNRKPNGESQAMDRTNLTTESWIRPHHALNIKRILVPIDFSEPCKKALQYAVSVAREFEAEIVLLHVVQPYPVIPDWPVATPQMTATLMTNAVAELENFAATVKEIEIKRIVSLGNPAREIAAEAERRAVDVIIINTHGRTGLVHMFIGSVAEQVVRFAKCPVLIVRECGHDFLNIAADDAELNRIGSQSTST